MRIAIYGVSRSGKDFFINDLIKSFRKLNNNIGLYHINGSTTLKNLSLKRYNKAFNNLSELEKNTIRKDFVEYANEVEKEHGSIIVDGHYAFYKENMTFNKVFTEYDLNFYDYYFYLDTDAIDIFYRMRMSDGEKKNDILTEEDIIKWKNYEIVNMSEELLSVDKELHVIKYTEERIESSDNKSMNLTISYVLGSIMFEYDSKYRADKILQGINLKNYNSVILVDCDKTLSYEDTTLEILKMKGIDDSTLKDIYLYDRYTNYQALKALQFYCNNKVFNDVDLDTLVDRIHLNEDLIKDLKTKKYSRIIAITAGNHEVWDYILKKVNLDAIVLNGDMIMSKYIKYYTLKKLQEMGKYVIAVGDSMLDSLMLRFANKSYIISNKGKRESIQNLLICNPQIHQLSYSKFLYENITINDSIDSIICISDITNEIANNISICKSDSGITGKLLRNAHYSLGIELAKLIQKDYPNKKFAVVIMMRSGLCFGQGIADFFDCPELFYEDSNSKKFDDEFYCNSLYKDRIIILVDGVINSGKSMREIIAKMNGYKTIIATNVISSKFNVDYIHPIYATRISGRSFVGAKQQIISNGKGPDTSDRLFRNM